MMKLRFAACIGLALGYLAVAPVQAQRIEQADRSAIDARIDAFDAMMKAGRFEEMVDFMPPRMWRMLLDQSGVTDQQMRAIMKAQMIETFKTVKIISYSMDSRAATLGTTPDKTRDYLLIPTETVMEIPDGQRLLSKSRTLALKDGNQWYVARIQGPQQILMLRAAYPEFAGVDFPSDTTAVVD
jgi:hypothetical protein